VRPILDTTRIDRDDVGLAVGAAFGIGTASAFTSGGPRPLLVGFGTALLAAVTVLAFVALE